MCSYGHLQNVNDMVSYVLQPNLRQNITSSFDTPMYVTSTPDMMPLNKLEKGPL